MRHNSSFRQGQKKAEERKKLLKAAVIPLVAVILMFVIVIADRDKDADKQAGAEPAVVSEATGEQQTESMDEVSSAAADGEKGSSADGVSEEGTAEPASESEEVHEPILQKDGVPELLSMMKAYYQARATGDAELLNKLYGIEGLSVAALEAEKTRMRSNSKYLRGFDNIVTYVADGLTENEWLVYSTCDMHFHSVDTVAPMIMWCYVVKQEDGTLLIQKPEALSPEVLHHVDVISRSQEVRSLASDINVRLKDALLADSNLNEVYGVLRDGSPVYQGDGAEEKEAVQVLDEAEAVPLEREAAVETEAESEIETEADSSQEDAEIPVENAAEAAPEETTAES